MKIAIFLPNLNGGGAERVMLDLASEFVRQGHQVTFVLMQAIGEFLEEAQSRFTIANLETPRIRNAFFRLRNWLKFEKPEVLLSGMWPLTSLSIVAAMGSDCRVIVSEHCVLSKQYENWGRAHYAFLKLSIAATFPRASARIGVSNGVARDVEQLGWLRSGSVNAIYNPVKPAAKLSPRESESNKAVWKPNKGHKILSVGNLKSVKNYPLLLKALARLSKGIQVQLIILGKGPMLGELQQLAINLGIADRVQMPGFVADPTPYYHTADLFVLASNYEGFGNVIVEALATGTPVVSTDCPSGPNEILQNGKYGILVPVDDEIKLTEAMSVSLATSHDVQSLHSRAQDFLPSIIAGQYLELMQPLGSGDN